MNIVKGVADLIRRTSSGPIAVSGSQANWSHPPGPKIRFGEVGDEAILNELWVRCEKAADKGERKRMFYVFLKQFIVAYKNWKPINSGWLSEDALTSVENLSTSDNTVVGCSSGHPAEIILKLTEEVKQLTSLIVEWRSTADLLGASIGLNLTSEGFLVLDALAIVMRSMHNCKVFGYYSGIQKLTALMKGAVIQLKTIAGEHSVDEGLSNIVVENTKLLQQMLKYVVSIVHIFIDIDSLLCVEDHSLSMKVPTCEERLMWRQKAVVSVMEAGGINWLVELLRVSRRLNIKEQNIEVELQFLALKILYSALSENPRGQNHFKSIGGLEVLLDGLGLPSKIVLAPKDPAGADQRRDESRFLNILQLHVLSLAVLREAVFGNLNNMQFLCENGRVHKFANSFCSPAFMLQEYKMQIGELSGQHDFRWPILDSKYNVAAQSGECSVVPLANLSHIQSWNEYVVKLCRVLCSFLLAPEDVKPHHPQASYIRIMTPVSLVYGDLSIKWVMRVLVAVFPCIRACSNQNDLPAHLRILANALQHSVLTAFRKFLVSSPVSLEIFREEGIWDLFFSEDFFYFGHAREEFFLECCTNNDDDFLEKPETYYATSSNSPLKVDGVDIIQIEVISFVEFAATSCGSAHNLPELSALLDTLEQSACNPEVAVALSKSLLRILQLSSERTVASFKTLNVVPRLLKVACVQAQEHRRSGNVISSEIHNVEDIQSRSNQGHDSRETAQSCLSCLETIMEVFTEFFSIGDEAKSLVLLNSTSIDCLFDLFWEESLRGRVLKHTLELIKIKPISEEDQKAKLYICTKYLEMFAQIKEREKSSTELSIDLLVGIREMVLNDPQYYQTLFRDGECFLHIVSLLNGNVDEANGEKLILNVLQTLTCLLAKNEVSKASFRALAGKGYQTMQTLLLDFCQCHPSDALLTALLDMLVDGNFDSKLCPIIQFGSLEVSNGCGCSLVCIQLLIDNIPFTAILMQNEDVIILYLSVLQKSSEPLQHQGLNMFQQLLRDSISNRASCVRAGMLTFLLDWFGQDNNEDVIVKIAQLIQVIGGHSVSGKDIRKIFALLRSEKVGKQRRYCSLLMASILSMLTEKGPTAFFDLSGNNSGILIKTPVQWPLNKGFSFSCWLRVENFPIHGTMGLFSFLTENGRGCLAVLAKNKLIYESINLRRQSVRLHVNVVRKKWHFLCITHSIGRAFSGGSLLRCYVDGDLVSSERCRYAKVNEPLTNCTVGAKFNVSLSEEVDTKESVEAAFPFLGQIGPVYLFSDAISSEQVQGIHSLGPSYMYSFLDNDIATFSENQLPRGILNAKESLASKIIFGLNAQASSGKSLFNVSPTLDLILEKNSFEATAMGGTELCSRRLLQRIIYCVGGVTVLFPLISQSDRYESESNGQDVDVIGTKECLTAEVIELIASVLDENLPNQHQMHLLSGFSILGFLLQSVNPQQLNMETLAALKHLFNVIANCGFCELLIQDAISSIFLNLSIWIYSAYEVQRELYLFLIQQFDNDPRLLKNLCRLPLILDMICKFYCDKAKCKFASGSKTSLHPPVEALGERPTKDEIRKIRLLLLSLGEMSIRQSMVAADIKALIAFFERNQDVTCIEDVLHMVIRAIAQKTVLASFHEQVNFIGGCPIFVNLLRREFEPIRLLSLQFLGRLLVGLPSEKKGLRFFNLPSGKAKSVQDSNKKTSLRMQPLFSAISDRLFRFPPTDNLCAALFDVLLGGASPKQVLQKQNQSDGQRNKSPGSHFAVPQSLVLIFQFLCSCEDISARLKIITDLLDLLETNPSNIEAFMEYGWNAWLTACVKLDALQQYKVGSLDQVDDKINEQRIIRKLFSVVLLHCIWSVKGGWQQLEETATFLLMQSEKGQVSFKYFLRDMYEDLIQMLVDLSSGENIFVAQPCRDNTLYLLRLIDDMLIAELDHQLPVVILATVFDVSLDSTELELYISALHDVLQGESDDGTARYSQHQMEVKDDMMDEKWWHLYDKLWIIISEINGKGPNKTLPKSSTSGGPTFGQRARGLVESLNLPAAEMAAVVVSGGIGSALGGKPNRIADKAMLLRSERFPRIILRLVMLYICKSPLEKASRCAQQFISLLPSLVVTDDEQNKNRLQLFIWSLLAVRSQYRMLNNDARIHVISHLIRGTVSCCKSILANSIISTDDSSDTGVFIKETGYIHNLIQKERVTAAMADEASYMKTSKIDHEKQLHELRIRMEENFSNESNNQKVFEDEMQSSLASILIADDNRRAAFQLSYEEEQQNIAEKWMHMFRALIDERGPWSANSSPNISSTHWKLDKTEDMWRRRPKLRKNYHFDEKLCHPPSISPGVDIINAENENKSSIVGHIPEQMKRFLLKGVRKITDEGNSELIENDVEQCERNASSLKDSSDGQYPELIKDVGDWKDIVQDRKDTSLFSPMTEESEVLMSSPCILVTPKRKLAGRLAVMKNVLHFFGEFLVEGTGGASTFKNFEVLKSSNLTKLNQRQKSLKPLNLQLDSKKSTVDNMEVMNDDGYLKRPLKNVRRHRRWDIGKIKGVHWTRYLLRYTAIEIFFSDSVAPVFFNFDSPKDAKDIGTLIVSSRNDYLFPKGSSRNQSGGISFVDRRVALEMAETARESWRRRDITNFEYLMILNTLSGRSYNDLTQYPVFPWILADYSSEVLDFNKSSTFRDLSKPVGALDLKRFEVFEDRYRNFCDPDIPSFYYGSHYSSMGIVLYYLLRLEPFTSLHRNLQGGKFDHADRLFQSIDGTYRNCLSNTSDVKELIPEFFYMPEFLCNSNHYHMGVKQDGEPIGDVVLPPWAKGSPEVFISRNREALESEYVSSNLHHWIDLVFGYKQRGKPAVEAANVFYYLTYEGAVDLDTMEDDLQRSAIEDQIANFGQTPIQIFRKKHPRRGPPIPIAHPLYFAPGSINLTSIISCSTNPPLAILHISMLDTHIVLVSQGLVLTVKMWLTTQLQYGGNFTFSGSQEPFFGVGSDVLSPRKIGSPLAENFELGGQCFATMQTPVENFLVSCGNWDNSFHIISVADGRLLQSVRQHSDVVSCVAVTSDGSILATGSYDTTVMVWKVLRGRNTEKRVRSTQSEPPRKDYVIAETPFHVLCGHDDIITCLYVSVELDIVISGSKDGTCIFHTLREGRYIRSLHHPAGCGLSKLVASRHGRVVFYADDDLSLHLYSINGKHLAASESNGRLNCVELSQCGEFLVCAGDHGQIVVRSMNSLEVISRYNGIGKVIVSLTVTAEECFLAGTKDGSLLVYSIENPQLRKTSVTRNTKSKPSAAG